MTDTKEKSEKDFDEDYEFSRSTYRTLIGDGLEVIPRIKELADDSEHPRAYEVFFQGLKHLADMNDKLANLHRKFQVMEIDGKKLVSEPAQGAIEQAKDEVFEGTTADLQSALDRLRAERENIIDAEFEEMDRK